METVHDLEWFNALSFQAAHDELLKCCGATRWAKTLAQRRPFATFDELLAQADEIWWALDQSYWLEAFRSHPKIGERKAAASVATQSQQWSTEEQRGVRQATQDAVERLSHLNRDYEEQFGFIFIVCATGKSTDEILALLEQRMPNDRLTELRTAAAEQAKIIELRLRKLIGPS